MKRPNVQAVRAELAGLDAPALLVVSVGDGDRERVLGLGEAAADGGAWALLVREPALGGGELRAVVDALAARRPRLRILVSDRVDVALATAAAAGVQLGERGLPVDRVRAWVGDQLLIGRSVHDVDGARAAVAAGADWLVFGHVYATASKPGLAPAGVDRLAGVARASSRPVLAIGGIDVARVASVRRAGARGVAVIGAVARAPEPSRAVAELVRALAEAP